MSLGCTPPDCHAMNIDTTSATVPTTPTTMPGSDLRRPAGAGADGRAGRGGTGGCHGELLGDRVAASLLFPMPAASNRSDSSRVVVTGTSGLLGRMPVRRRAARGTDPGGTAQMAGEWGPLEALAGDWESDKGGLDAAFSHSKGEVLQTPYLEKLTLKPFGPVDNGNQHLYGLDYKSAMWRGDEENPFHTEVGYWLWDSATNEVMRGFVVPRGITVLAGGVAAADAKSFTLVGPSRRPQLLDRREQVPLGSTRRRSATTSPSPSTTTAAGRTTRPPCSRWTSSPSRSRTPTATRCARSAEPHGDRARRGGGPRRSRSAPPPSVSRAPAACTRG